jgi:hypothetical protein
MMSAIGITLGEAITAGALGLYPMIYFFPPLRVMK